MPKRKLKPGEKVVAVITVTVTQEANVPDGELTQYTDFGLRRRFFKSPRKEQSNILHNAMVGGLADADGLILSALHIDSIAMVGKKSGKTS
jgi:hypothetical protein